MSHSRTHWKLGCRQQSALECSGISDGLLDEELAVVSRYWDPRHPEHFRKPTSKVDAEALWWALVELSNHNDNIAHETQDRDQRVFCRQDATAFSDLASKVIRCLSD